jgi:Protein of unknown function (DUF3007)
VCIDVLRKQLRVCTAAGRRRRTAASIVVGAGGLLHHVASVSARAEPKEKPVQYNKDFGYSRKDVILIGAGLTGLGYALYYGLQAVGVEQMTAGNITQLIIFVGLCVGWIGSYVFRVANKVCHASLHSSNCK